MKHIFISILLCSWSFGCQNQRNQASSSVEENNLAKSKSETNILVPIDTIKFISLEDKSNTKERRVEQDTINFIAFWKLFRNAVLEHNIKELSSRLNDSIFNANFLIRNFTNFDTKSPQTVIIEKFYDLFTPDYLLLLKEYDIHKDLFSDITEFGFKKYQCKKEIGKRTYQAHISFNGYQPVDNGNFTVIVCYNMRCDMEEDPLIDLNFGSIYNIVFSLEFNQILNEFKLCEIGGCYNMSIASE